MTRVNDDATGLQPGALAAAEVDAERRRLFWMGSTAARGRADAAYLGVPTSKTPRDRARLRGDDLLRPGGDCRSRLRPGRPSMDRQELYVAASRSREETLSTRARDWAMGREE